jgi:hypothetical protein
MGFFQRGLRLQSRALKAGEQWPVPVAELPAQPPFLALILLTSVRRTNCCPVNGCWPLLKCRPNSSDQHAGKPEVPATFAFDVWPRFRTAAVNSLVR